MPDERRALELERLHQREHESAPVAERMVGGIVGAAEPGQIGGHDAQPMRSQAREIARPDVGGGAERSAMQQDHRRPAAVLEEPRIQAVDAERPVLHVCSAMSISTPSTSAR